MQKRLLQTRSSAALLNSFAVLHGRLATILSAPLHAQVKGWLIRPLAMNAVLTCALYILIACPLALISFHEQVGAREEPYRLVQTTGLKDAIVILDTSSAMGMAPQDLVRNQPSLDQPVLYARRDVDVSELHRRFPSRTIWTYQRPYPAEPGRLVPITTTQ